MTFPRQGTRRLTIAGRPFVWHISPKGLDSGSNACTVQAASGHGRLLCFWPELHDGFPSPREASVLIAFALDHGWDPAAPGCPLWVERRATGLALTDRRPVPPWARVAPIASTVTTAPRSSSSAISAGASTGSRPRPLRLGVGRALS